MIPELCITLTMRAAALGHTLAEAQCLAFLALLQLVLLCTLFGHRLVRPEEDDRLWDSAVPVPGFSIPFTGVRGILPVVSGTAGRSSRTLLLN